MVFRTMNAGPVVFGRCHDVAHFIVAAIGRVEVLACQNGLLEISGQHLEFNLSGSNIGELLLDETRDVCARDLTGLAKLNRAQNLLQGQARGLGGADEPQSSDGLIVIATVAAARSFRVRQQALAFIEANRLTANAGDNAEFSDKHPPIL